MDYGFVLEDNPNDVVLVPIPNASESDPLFEDKERLLEELQIG
jgi:hypothetical protein